MSSCSSGELGGNLREDFADGGVHGASRHLGETEPEIDLLHKAVYLHTQFLVTAVVGSSLLVGPGEGSNTEALQDFLAGSIVKFEIEICLRCQTTK